MLAVCPVSALEHVQRTRTDGNSHAFSDDRGKVQDGRQDATSTAAKRGRIRSRRRFGDVVRVTANAIVVMLTLAHSVQAQEAALPAFRIYISDARVGSAAMQALGLASARLATPACQGLLREYADDTGKPLADKLAALRMSAEAYLRVIVLVDGSRLRPCLGTHRLAFTTPGRRVVYLCGTSFATTLQQSPVEATMTIIHELLHSLGLGENPPSSEAISRRVRQRCW